MLDKDTVLQVIGGLMKQPQYLSEKDKYSLSIGDFPNRFEKYIFSAIYNLYKDGARVITPTDVDNYFNTHAPAKDLFEKSNGIEYLQDVLDFCEPDNFPFYYKRLKKFNCLKDLKKYGFDTSSLYCEDLTNPKFKEINDRFEQLEVSQIFESVKKGLMLIETNYSSGEASETNAAASGIRQLLEDLKVRPEVGASLQGDIFNTICRGARKTKFYIRSASSGVGKTRHAIGDACQIAYPLRFNTENWQWESTGNAEKTLFIATEQELDEIQTLVLAYLTGFNEENFLYDNFNFEQRKIVEQAVRVMEAYSENLFIVRLSNPNIEQIKAVVRQNWILHNIQNVFYDYIFSSPSLLNEFRDLRIREDVALNLLSTALKDLAVELKIFVMSATQTNAKSDEDKAIKNEAVIRGARSIIDKCDIACVVSRVTKEDEEILAIPIQKCGMKPNQVTDVYKVRRGKYTNVRIWSYVDLGTCRKIDLFVTNERLQEIDDFQYLRFEFGEEEDLTKFIESLNEEVEKPITMVQPIVNDEEDREANSLEKVDEEEKKAKGLFGDLL